MKHIKEFKQFITESDDTIGGLNKMANTDLERIADYADMIKDRMSQGQTLDAWMYSKISDSVKNLNSVHDTMDGNDGVVESTINEGKTSAVYKDPKTGKGYDLQYVSGKKRWELDVMKKDASIYSNAITTIKRDTLKEIQDWLDGYKIDSKWTKGLSESVITEARPGTKTFFKDRDVLPPHYGNSELHDKSKEMFKKSWEKLSNKQQDEVLSSFPKNESVVNEGKGAENYFDDLKYNYTKSLRYLDKDEKKEYNKLAKDFFSKISESAVIETELNEAEKAEGDRSKLSADIEKALKDKATESGVPIGLLRLVMRRGLDAWNSSHREGVPQVAWGYARVNAFLEKGKGTWGKADADIAKEVRDGGNASKLPIKNPSEFTKKEREA